MAFDVLEAEGRDIRELPLSERRARLEAIVEGVRQVDAEAALRCSPVVELGSWDELEGALAEASARRVEGLMLKRRDAAYGVGRPRGVWWKWKVEPYTIDAVLVQAERGHGKRAGLFTDYTFAVWRGEELVPIAKAYSGLSNAEIEEVDRFIRQHTTERYGPVNVVEPRRVFELAFERVQRSSRHKAGLAVRFPRIVRPRPDKSAAGADRLETLEAMIDEA
jgi:DNA ligase-1